MTYYITYTFLNVPCEFETKHWLTFCQKIDWLDNTKEVLKPSIKIRTEEK